MSTGCLRPRISEPVVRREARSYIILATDGDAVRVSTISRMRPSSFRNHT